MVLNSEETCQRRIDGHSAARRSKVSEWLQRYQTEGRQGSAGKGIGPVGQVKLDWHPNIVPDVWAIEEEVGVRYHPVPVRRAAGAELVSLCALTPTGVLSRFVGAAS